MSEQILVPKEDLLPLMLETMKVELKEKADLIEEIIEIEDLQWISEGLLVKVKTQK